MTDETIVTTGEAGTSATAAGAGVTISTEGAPKNIREMLLYKLDRTLAVLGIIAIGVWALKIKTPESIQIAAAVIGYLGGFISGRGK